MASGVTWLPPQEVRDEEGDALPVSRTLPLPTSGSAGNGDAAKERGSWPVLVSIAELQYLVILFYRAFVRVQIPSKCTWITVAVSLGSHLSTFM